MPESVNTDTWNLPAIGTAVTGTPVGSEVTWFAATPHALAPTLAFISWGQTDILFGGVEMDTPYSGLG